MRNNISALIEMPPTLDHAQLVARHELGQTLGVSQRQALELTRREDFPEPVLFLHRQEPNETLPQPRPVWDRADVERWAKASKRNRT
jgi:hypothetical protein